MKVTLKVLEVFSLLSTGLKLYEHLVLYQVPGAPNSGVSILIAPNRGEERVSTNHPTPVGQLGSLATGSPPTNMLGDVGTWAISALVGDDLRELGLVLFPARHEHSWAL